MKCITKPNWLQDYIQRGQDSSNIGSIDIKLFFDKTQGITIWAKCQSYLKAYSPILGKKAHHCPICPGFPSPSKRKPMSIAINTWRSSVCSTVHTVILREPERRREDTGANMETAKRVTMNNLRELFSEEQIAFFKGRSRLLTGQYQSVAQSLLNFSTFFLF